MSTTNPLFLKLDHFGRQVTFVLHLDCLSVVLSNTRLESSHNTKKKGGGGGVWVMSGVGKLWLCCGGCF